jgi:hypothetical protein
MPTNFILCSGRMINKIRPNLIRRFNTSATLHALQEIVRKSSDRNVYAIFRQGHAHL